MTAKLEFHEGLPSEDGWYLVELDQPGVAGGKPYDVDYCRARSTSDGGGRQWTWYYQHNIKLWAVLPGSKGTNAT